MNQTVEQEDSPALRGMLDKVSHLVEVQEVSEK
jgi:ribosomal protein L30